MKVTLSLALVTLLFIQATSRGDIAPPGSAVIRFAQADCIVAGKVTEIETKTVKIPYPGSKDPVEFHVGVVKIEHLVKGEKGVTHVKVCFLPPTGMPERRPRAILKVGQETLLYLQKHPDEPYYFCPGYYGQFTKENGDYENQLTQVKQCAKLLADPDAGLKSKEEKERVLTTALLIYQYRRQVNPKLTKTEPINAAQSKAILQTLAALDWTKPDPTLGWDLTPQGMFLMLGLTREDGWVQPADGKEFPVAARKWLKENAESYRIKKWVQ